VTRSRAIPGIRFVVLTLEVCLFVALACLRCAALNPDRTIAQFAHKAWGPKDGAPIGIIALAQSADGFLWLGTLDGLYRFDGVTFERYSPLSGGPFPDQGVFSLLALPNGDLWVGFRTGAICLLKNGNATTYTTHDGLPAGAIRRLAQDREGTIWAATDNGLARLEGNRWKQAGTDWNFPSKFAGTVFLDRQGTLWVSTENTLVFLPQAAKRFQSTGIRVGQVTQIAQAPNGKLWMAETTRSVRPIPLFDRRQPPDDTEVIAGSQGILFDRDGALWITTLGDGLRRVRNPELLKGKIKGFSAAVGSFTVKDGLSDNGALSILQDREGNIWVGTVNGLDRFSKTALIPATYPFSTMNAVLAPGNSGDVWVNMVSIAPYLAGRTKPGHMYCALPESAYRDSAGAIWWLCTDAIYRYDAGKYTAVPLPPSFPKPYLNPAIVATEDGSGALWMAIRGGWFCRKDGGWQTLETPSEIAQLYPRTAFTDWMGDVWIGYGGVHVPGAIIVLDHGKIQRAFTGGDSPVGGVTEIDGSGHHLWVVGEHGLAFFDGTRFRGIIPSDADSMGSVKGVVEASDGSLWLVENLRILQIPASEVQHVLRNPFWRVQYRTFDFYDGLPGTFGGTTIYRKEIQGTDGRLWFASSGGIVWVDPAHVLTNRLPPPVVIRFLKVNGKQYASLAKLTLPPRTSNLQIDYTALSLVVPEKVRFRYMLKGVDKEWQDAGTRREAFYTRLGPGEYHFNVIACNNDGIWNDQGARLDFRIAPAWFQTSWFDALCVCAFLLLLWVLYQLRLRQLRQQFHVVVETRVDERTRIARELHDTLLQSFQGVILHFQRARNLLPGRTPEAIQTLDAALDGAEHAIMEGRDAIYDLRSPTTAPKTLEEEIQALGEELVANKGDKQPAQFGIVVEGSARKLQQDLHTEIFRIVREALRNAFSHSQGRLIETELAYTDRLFRLRIRDDGKGIDQEERLQAERGGHWGLRGMRERSEHLGGEFEVWSEPGAGTEIELRIPAKNAYEKVISRSSSWLLWKRNRDR